MKIAFSSILDANCSGDKYLKVDWNLSLNEP